MFNPESTKVSYFRPPVAPVKGPDGRVIKYANQTPNGTLTIYQVYRLILGEPLREGAKNDLPKLTEDLRKITDPDPKREHDLRADFKKQNLPFVSFGGEFSYRKNDKVTTPSCLVCLDLDGKDQSPRWNPDDIPSVASRLSEDPELDPVLLFRSPTGAGLKIVVPVRQEIRNDKEFKDAYTALERYLRERHQIVSDEQRKDIAGACFLCYDPEALFRESKVSFDVEKWTPPVEAPQPRVPQAPQGRPLGETMGLTDGPSDYIRALIAVEDIERSKISLTDGRNDWRDIGFALSNLGEEGRDLFHRLSRMAGSRYDPKGTDEFFSEALGRTSTGNRIELETLFVRAKNAGVSLRSSNVYSRPQTRQTPRGNQPSGPSDVPPVGPQDIPEEYVVRQAEEPSPKWLLDPTTEREVIERESSLPEALPTGYEVKGENGIRQKLLLLSGKLTTIAGATGHGKTLLLMNILLNVSRLNPDKKFILLTYEENSDSILEYLLNIYLSELNLMRAGDWRTNRVLIREYFSGKGTGGINPSSLSDFNLRKGLFFRDYIENGRILIKYIDSDSTKLCRDIRFLSAPENNIGGVFVDYFQCINPAEVDKNGRPQRFPTRQEALKSICFELKDIANETGLPVVLGCQFNQEVQSPTDVLLNKIGEAGDISRIVSECWGLWQMGKDIGRTLSSSENQRVEVLNNKSKDIGTDLRTLKTDPFLKGMFLRVLKSRIVETGSEEMFKFRGLTGKIYPNDPDLTLLSSNDWDRPDPNLPLDDDDDLPI